MTFRKKIVLAAAAVAGLAALALAASSETKPPLRVAFTADGRGEIEPCG